MSRAVGSAWERIAECYLRARGLRLVERNFVCHGGEIDLVMRAGETLVFVEVRFRSERAWVAPFESVDSHKRSRLCRAAANYVGRESFAYGCPVRFDIIGITRRGRSTRVNWLPAAFECDGF